MTNSVHRLRFSELVWYNEVDKKKGNVFLAHKTEWITLRIPGDVKPLLEQSARALNISINDYSRFT